MMTRVVGRKRAGQVAPVVQRPGDSTVSRDFWPVKWGPVITLLEPLPTGLG